MTEKKFWETKSLEEMTGEEWEALCDGCGLCCLVLLESEEDTSQPPEIWETRVTCKLFDASCRRCKDYTNRQKRVPGCVPLTAQNIAQLKWMPESCAYRRIAERRGLPDWHPLRTGDRQSVVTAGLAVAATLPSETEIDEADLELHISKRRWPPE